MRFPKKFIVRSVLVLLLSNSHLSEAGQRDTSLSGRLMLENGDFDCDQCVVTLLAGGSRPVARALVDLSGHFSFSNVSRGSYIINIEIDGFEDVNQSVEAYSASETNVMVTLVRKRPNPTVSDVVDISEFLDRYPKKAVSLFEKGSDSLQQKKYAEAVQYLRNAVELAPTFYEAHNRLGIAYREAGRIDDAEREFIKAHELNSKGIDPLIHLTTLYLEESQPDRAVTTSEQAVKANSHSAPAFFSLGLALYKAAQLDRAETALKRALELAPKMANIRLMLANVYMKLRRYDNTLEQLNTYIAENPHGDQLPAAQTLRDKLLAAKAGFHGEAGAEEHAK
jgi:Flp pilus assembly protein TadD